MLWEILVFLGGVAGWVYWQLRHQEVDHLLSSIPGPKPVPLLGNIFTYAGLGQVEMFKKMRQHAAEYGDRFKIKILDSRVVSIMNPDDVEVILSSSKNIKKSRLYSFLKSWLQEGLLLSDGEKWRNRRRILTPAFHFTILKEFSQVMQENSDKLVQELSRATDKTDLVPLISKFTLLTICETAMGTQLDRDNSASAVEYKSAIMEVGHMMIKRVTKIWMHFDILYNNSSDGKAYNKTLDAMHSFPKRVIMERKISRQGRAETCAKKETPMEKKKKRRMAMLDLLLDAEERQEIDLQGIQEEVDTFMFEGHDTTAAALIFALMLLGNNPVQQESAFEEVSKTTDLNSMPYLEACIKETLRLYPSVPFISREITSDCILGGAVVKKGVNVDIHIYDIHRRADIFPEPTSFEPNRFLSEDQASRHPYAYIPFSAGPRNCIGKRFAMLEMKCLLATVLRKYRILPITKPEEIVMLSDLVLRAKDPIYVQFTPRVSKVYT